MLEITDCREMIASQSIVPKLKVKFDIQLHDPLHRNLEF
jgi:hypothetical protein